MKQLIDKIKEYCKKRRVAVSIIALAFVLLLTVSIVVPVAVSNAKTLNSIEIMSLPAKTEYIERQALNTDGLRVSARYKNGKSEEVFGYIVDKTDLTVGKNDVKVSYTHKDITKTTSFTVTVSERSLVSVQITKQPNALTYSERTYFNPAGLEVTAVYSNGESEIVTGYYFDKAGALQVGDTAVIITYAEKNVAKTASIAITVNPRKATAIEVSSQPTRLSYIEGSVFDPTGLVVKAYFDNGEEAFVSGWDYDKKGALSAADTAVIITYGGKSAAVGISVGPKKLTAIMASSLPQRVVYYEGEYFDFLGLEIYASYANTEAGIVSGWDYDKKTPLTSADTQVIVSYTLHGITKTLAIGIAVVANPRQNDGQTFIDRVLELLLPTQEMTEDNLDAIDYALGLLNSAAELTSEQQAKKEELEAKKLEILDGLEPEPEAEYSVAYAIAGGLIFGDVAYGLNPTTYKASDGTVPLNAAASAIAAEQGYIFVGWKLNGVSVTALENVAQDAVVYAVFELTATVSVKFIDYDDETTELAALAGIVRTAAYKLEINSLVQVIYFAHGVLPIAYYSAYLARITEADLSIGATVTVYVKTALPRELHLANADSVTLSWVFGYSDKDGERQAARAPSVGMVFVVPVGATVTMISMHANITDIAVDGVSKAGSVNNSIVQAVFVLPSGEYAAAVTFVTALTGVTTISIIGNNQTEYVYPADWNGVLAAVDLETLAFVFDETNTNYLNVYTIDGTEYYFDDLAAYVFGGDTAVWVTRIKNRFTFTVVYENGTESFDSLVGRQSLQAALSGYGEEATELLNGIFSDDSLFTDADFRNPISAAEVLAMILRRDLTVYGDWFKPVPATPGEPAFDPVDYAAYGFVGEWSALLGDGGNILMSGLILAADGTYCYRTYVNGIKSVEISGVYRVEGGVAVIKTLVYQYEYALLSAENLTVNILFAEDGLISAAFIQLSGSSVSVFGHTMTAGNIRPVNYYGCDFVGTREYEGATIELLANGTAAVTYQEATEAVYYRVADDNILYVFSNGAFGTRAITDLLGGIA